GEPDEAALRVHAGHPALRHPRREAQHRRTGAAADIKNLLMRLRGDRGGEQHRIDRRPRTVGRLAQNDAAAKQAVLGYRLLRRTRNAHRSSFSAAASSAAARLWSRVATIRRRGMAPMLPSTRLV